MNKGILLPVLSLLLAVVILLGVSFGLKGVAESKAQAEHLRLLRTVLPDSENFVVEPYAGDDANIRSVHKGETGYVIETVTAGYASDICMLVGVSNEGKVVGIVVREMHETRGLGSRALTDTDFLSQLLCTSGEAAIGTDVDALSGATVTSKAVVRCVNSAAAYVTGVDTSSGATSWGG